MSIKVLPRIIYIFIIRIILIILFFVQYSVSGQTGIRPFPFEKADRELIAIATDSKQVYLGWRLLYNDPAEVGFHIYRVSSGGKAVRINEKPMFPLNLISHLNFRETTLPTRLALLI